MWQLLAYVGTALAVCHAQLIYPDEFESMKLEAEKRFTSRRPYTKGWSGDFQKVDFSKPREEERRQPYFGQSFAPPRPAQAPARQTYAPLRQTYAPQRQTYATSSQPHIPSLSSVLPDRWRDHVINIISKGVTKFTLDMDRTIENTYSSNHENLLFSPVSLTLTLAMVLLASSGKTFEEVTKILGLESGVDISNHSEIVHQIFGFLIQQFNQDYLLDKNSPQCKVAFGIFVEDGYPIRKEFRAVSDKVYNSDVINVNFSKYSSKAQSIINNWIDEKTMGKIKRLLSEPPNPTTKVIIASALYFSGEWNQHFSEGATKRKPFRIEANETIYTDMMYTGGSFPFYEDKGLGLKIIAFPYKGLKVSMYAILPTVEGTAALREAKRRLSPEIIDGLIDKMRNSSCIIGYPKMELSSTLRLQSALESLGLKSLFDQKAADLSLLSPGRNQGDSGSSEPFSISSRSYEPTSGATENHLPSNDRTPIAARQTGNFKNFFYAYETSNYTVEQWNNGHHLQYSPRAKRQSRPIDQEFVNFLESQRLPSFGVDELRNAHGISNPGLYADDVLHKVKMTVNEKGTEAAAVTSVLLDRSGDFKRFIANRPFMFFIRHDSDRLIWFWGSINRPEPFYTSP